MAITLNSSSTPFQVKGCLVSEEDWDYPSLKAGNFPRSVYIGRIWVCGNQIMLNSYMNWENSNNY